MHVETETPSPREYSCSKPVFEERTFRKEVGLYQPV